MLIVCPNCKKQFDIGPGRGEETRKLRCSNCRAVFKVVRKVTTAQQPLGEPAVAAPSAAFADPWQEAAPAAIAPGTALPQIPAAAPADWDHWGDVAESVGLSTVASAVGGASAVGAASRRDSDSPALSSPLQAPIKVVVANESAAFCDAVRKVLASEPFEVIVCNDGKVALETVERINPALLLLDVALPTIFGFEVCERVRQNPALSDVKIVLIASIYDKTRYKRSPNSLYGADDYIEKHHIPDSLVPLIYRLTSGTVPPSQDAQASESEAAQTRSEIRQAEVHETTIAVGSAPILATEGETLSLDGNRYEKWREDPPEAFPLGAESSSAASESVALQEIMPAEEIAPFEELSAPLPQTAPPQLSEAEVKARRLARIIVSDIVLYNQGKVEQGVREGNFYDLLADDIKEGERLYRQRVPEHVRENTNFLNDAFEDLLAKKRGEMRN